MTYLDYILQFQRLRRQQPFPSTSADLYYHLLWVSNGLNWKNPFNEGSAILMAALGMTDKTLAGARDKLIAAGLIKYWPGKKGTFSTYELLTINRNTTENFRSIQRKSQESSTNATENFRSISGESGVESGGLHKSKTENEIIEETPTPSEPEKKTGAGEFLEDSTSSLIAEAQIVPPVAEPPHETAAKPAEAAPPAAEPPRHSEASRELARKMAALWHITEQGNARKWMQLARFTHFMEQAGRLAELTRQFAGYALYREKRRIQPYNLDKYLGSEGDAYAGGEWCGCDWDSRAKATKADGDNSPPPSPKRADFGPARSKKIIW